MEEKELEYDKDKDPYYEVWEEISRESGYIEELEDIK